MSGRAVHDRYQSRPAVRGEARPAGAREVHCTTAEVRVGDLLVFTYPFRHAYQVGSIDRLDDTQWRMRDPAGRKRALIRFHCGDGVSGVYGDLAVVREGDPVTLLELLPDLSWACGRVSRPPSRAQAPTRRTCEPSPTGEGLGSRAAAEGWWWR